MLRPIIKLLADLGKEYSDGFHELYSTIAEEQNIPLIPFLLLEVAGKPELNQADGIHPTAEGHVLMSKVVLDAVTQWRSEWSAD